VGPATRFTKNCILALNVNWVLAAAYEGPGALAGFINGVMAIALAGIAEYVAVISAPLPRIITTRQHKQA